MLFRSSPAILATVNYLFRSIMREYLGKVEYDHSHEFELIEGITETQLGDPVEVVYVTGGEEQTDKGAREQEALAIVQKIKGIEGYKYSDIVILLRSMTGWAEEFVEVLTSNGIPAVAEQKKGCRIFTNLGLVWFL